MRISTEALTECIGVLAGLDGVDAGALAGDEAMAWLAAGGRARQSLDAVLAALTSRIEELSQADDRGNRFARRKGFSNAAALVTEVAQVPRSDAGRLVTLGQAMSDADAGSAKPLTLGAVAESEGPLPLYAHLAQEMARGFSAEKATLIRRVLKAMTADVATVEIERSLVERARKRTVEQVRVMCMNEFARIDREGYLRFQRVQRTQRTLKFWDSDDGMFNIHGKLDAVAAIPLRTWLEDDVRKALHNQRGIHPSEQLEPEQLAADALAELALHRLGCQDDASGPKSTIVIQVTEEALAAGTGMARCHGYSAPISVELLPQIAVDAQRMTAIMGSEGLPLYLGRAQRLFTPAQRLAIALRDGGCARCGAPVARCHVHHIKWWSNDGPTDLDNGVLLCSGCHHRLHDFGWEIDVIAGEVWFVPPLEVDGKRERIPACSTRVAPQRA